MAARLGRKARAPETLRVISVNGNISVDHAAFDKTILMFPTETWLLIWGGYIVHKYEPDIGDNNPQS